MKRIVGLEALICKPVWACGVAAVMQRGKKRRFLVARGKKGGSHLLLVVGANVPSPIFDWLQKFLLKPASAGIEKAKVSHKAVFEGHSQLAPWSSIERLV